MKSRKLNYVSVVMYETTGLLGKLW